MSDFLTVLRAKLQAKIDERATAKAEIDALLATPATEGRTELTPEETAKFTEARAKVKALDADLDKDNTDSIAYRVADLEQMEARRYEAVAKSPAQAARVKSEARTYNKDSDRTGQSFLLDVARASVYGANDWDAQQRLNRHMQEERIERGGIESRAAGTGAFAGLVVPQYLTDMVAPAVANMRPFADICNTHPLPADGMTVNISRVTTATSAAAQSSENSAVSETNIDDTLLTESVFTVAGQQTLSRQAIDRGTGTEDITLNDLIRRYHSALDTKLINDATTGITNTTATVAYTDASPTAAELYPKVLAAQSAMEVAFADQGVGEVYAVMHSRRWAWMQSQVGTSWPFIGQPGYAAQSGGQNYATGYGQGVRGILPNGIGVIVDNNIATNLGAGTNEDEIYVVNAAELHLWEDPNAPLYIRTEATAAASLGVLMVVYGYAAYSFRRYTSAHQKIAGTGLVVPAF
jgi:HK97 family phage major capsid protein